ncbi:hypothetical protein T281_13805 [Rhodomicrobium udaipurense JA643]|nr:hypothetical protein T281_13805 [Rhodomicrobium udaipurense JA643]
MRAKMKVTFVQQNFYALGPDGKKCGETLSLCAVYASKYPEDGSDENNTYAKFTPQAELKITVANPELWGKFAVGDEFYVDFTSASKPE